MQALDGAPILVDGKGTGYEDLREPERRLLSLASFDDFLIGEDDEGIRLRASA